MIESAYQLLSSIDVQRCVYERARANERVKVNYSIYMCASELFFLYQFSVMIRMVMVFNDINEDIHAYVQVI